MRTAQRKMNPKMVGQKRRKLIFVRLNAEDTKVKRRQSTEEGGKEERPEVEGEE